LHGLPATFFIPTGFVGTDLVFPWDCGLKHMPNLTWDDVRTIRRLGFEIGSHTITHANLGTATAEQARQEIVDSKNILEKQVGSCVRWFAYPFGGVNNFRREWLPLLEEAGYEGCLSAHGGFIYRDTNTTILPRQAATGFESTLNLEIFLSGSLSWYYALKKRLGLQQPWQTFVPSEMDCGNTIVHPSQMLKESRRTAVGLVDACPSGDVK
jgi:hypothetical protein